MAGESAPAFEAEDPAEAVTQPLPVIQPAGAGRHRSPHRPKRVKAGATGAAAGRTVKTVKPPKPARPAKAAAPARRTGLLGASAAVAMGAVAMVSGLLPTGALSPGNEPGTSPGVGATGQVRPDSPPPGADQRSRPAAAPADRADQREQPGQEAGAEARRMARATLRQDAPASRGAERPPADALSAPPSAAPAGGHADAAPRQDSPAQRASRTAPRPHAAASGAAAGDEGTETRVHGTLADPRSSAAHLVLALVNAERAKAGCRPLRASSTLTRLAQSFSDDMARRGFFDHTDPDGRTPWDRAGKRGVKNLGGENIARGHPDARTVMDAWMRSSGHRANILNCDYKSIGVGVHHGGNGPYWTQDFGY